MNNKYWKIIERIKSVGLSRTELLIIEQNARSALDKGDADARAIIDLIAASLPNERYFIFMGFCPGADFSNRQDYRWRAEAICDFFFYESERQMERFRSIAPGDLIILKKRQQFARTMKLYGHGRVKGKRSTAKGDRILEMDWSLQQAEIEVPLLGCNDTVNLRSVERVEGEMPKEFWEWLKA